MILPGRCALPAFPVRGFAADTHCRGISHKSKINRPPHLFGAWGRDSQPGEGEPPIDWSEVPDGVPAAGTSPRIGVHDIVAHIKPQAGDIVIMPEATCHGVLPWRAPAGRRRRIFSMRFHLQHGAFEDSVTPTKPLSSRFSCVEDFPEWQRSHLSPETLELLMGAPEGHVKEIAKRELVELAPFDELYPPLPRL